MNSYICIELNAHSLITYPVALQDEFAMKFSSDCYLPWLLGSQPCERAFHAARSMTSVYSTMINFSMQGLLQRLHKLQSFIELQYESDATNIIYPHKRQHSDKDGTGDETISSVTNITNEEIEAVVKSGYDRARQAMEQLGMRPLLESNKQWEFALGDVGGSQDDDDADDESSEEECSNSTNSGEQSNSDDEKVEISDVVGMLNTFEKKDITNSDNKVKLMAVFSIKASASEQSKTTIPVYKQLAKCEKQKQYKKDNKFIEIIHYDESIFVRKAKGNFDLDVSRRRKTVYRLLILG